MASLRVFVRLSTVLALSPIMSVGLCPAKRELCVNESACEARGCLDTATGSQGWISFELVWRRPLLSSCPGKSSLKVD